MNEDMEIVTKRFTDLRRELGKVVAELLKQFKINPLWLFGESSQKYLAVTNVSVIPKVVTVNSSENENMVLVNAKAAAGYPQNIQDTSWYKQLPAFDIPLPEFRNATYRGFQIEGDSMLPNLKPGEWVLARAVEGLKDISPNKIYVVVLQDAVLVKKIEKSPNPAVISLISLNENYPPYSVNTEDIQELWQVSSKITFGVDATSEKGLLRQLQESMDELKNQLKKVNN